MKKGRKKKKITSMTKIVKRRMKRVIMLSLLGKRGINEHKTFIFNCILI